ncbi:DUF4168 domain-containing protein [Geitlerinema sp. PCC 9228]|uniref:DUF4168 domain-containing protein n=1 Tax=Geitlerinema sp. PCC 9228 TaxID=111611 RepID=UPI0008F9C2C7|nr:DUF4168 domain-containing protein [Geitlerinema sp. PCC 9228]
MMPTIFSSQTRSPKSIWLRAVFALVGTSLAIGIEWQPQRPQLFSWQGISSVVSAQEASEIAGVSEEEILEYARVAYDIEKMRQQVYESIEEMTDGNVPELACNDEESLESVDREIRQVFSDWCQQSEKIIEESSLSISRFNEIHELREDNGQLKERIQEEVQKLRDEEGD